ncbi:hypothetical protein [Prescottella agglutinans]|uniref:Uncharacterized protein n=1 Tax=Prescottella agglutinans TaxID=1644129 RepID=A0ABT6MFP0_9NOCA|nr:hypothetical protein [Prescottella agglutinans]MDH6283140.1 hypothetical protein [Prescottella agglutinans]
MTDKTTNYAGITTELVELDADGALDLLKRNLKNRKPSQERIETYRRDMLEGRWSFTGEPIQIDTNGNLGNGQHRLMALAGTAGTGLNIMFLIVHGVKPEAQLDMDQGRKRTVGQQLDLLGFSNSNNVAAVLRVYLMWRNGAYFGDVIGNRVTSHETLDWARQHSEDVDFIQSNISKRSKVYAVRPAVTLAVGLILSKVAADDADVFLAMVAEGIGLYEGDPALALRHRLESAQRNREKLSDKETLAFYFTAWNAFRDGRKLSKLMRPKGGVWTGENFPHPR